MSKSKHNVTGGIPDIKYIPPPPPLPGKPLTFFETKKIGNLWYCYATHRGYDWSFCSDCEYYSIVLAKAIMNKNGWEHECTFPEL